VDERDRLAERFEAHRGELRAVAYRMLGLAAEADDAVQEAWLRLDRVGADGVRTDGDRTDRDRTDGDRTGEDRGIVNLGGWLRTVVTRICVDMLRARGARREVPADLRMLDDRSGPSPAAGHPEEQALLVSDVSRALLVVLETLNPAERIALVGSPSLRWSTGRWEPWWRRAARCCS